MVVLRLLVAASAAMVILAPASAGAVDLTGTWVGTLVCKDLFQGAKITFKQKPSTVTITQNGNHLTLSRNGTATFTGFVLEETAKPDNGRLAVSACGTDDVPGAANDDYDEMGDLTVKTKPSKGSGSIKGTSSFAEINEIGTCKWSYKRINTADPSVPGCL